MQLSFLHSILCVSGWIRECPVGACDSKEIDVAIMRAMRNKVKLGKRLRYAVLLGGKNGERII